jgi:hypothetical protein
LVLAVAEHELQGPGEVVPVPSMQAYSLSGSAKGGTGTIFRPLISPARSRTAPAAAAPLASAARSTRLEVSRTPARPSSRRDAFANGPAAAAWSFIAVTLGDMDAPATPSSVSCGARPCLQAAQWYQARARVTGPSTVPVTSPR